jgi:hypothetical protein
MRRAAGRAKQARWPVFFMALLKSIRTVGAGVFEAPGVEPVFRDKCQAMSYAWIARAFVQVRFAFWIQRAVA